MPLDILFLLIGAILLLSDSTQSAIKCRKHYHSQQQKSTRINHKLAPLSVSSFDYDFPDYGSGVFIDAVPISRTTKRALIGQAMSTKKGNGRNRSMGKVRTFGENARPAEWYETLFATRR